MKKSIVWILGVSIVAAAPACVAQTGGVGESDPSIESTTGRDGALHTTSVVVAPTAGPQAPVAPLPRVLNIAPCFVPSVDYCASTTNTEFESYVIPRASKLSQCPGIVSLVGTWTVTPGEATMTMTSSGEVPLSSAFQEVYLPGAEYPAQYFCRYTFTPNPAAPWATIEDEAPSLCAIAPADGLGIACKADPHITSMGCDTCGSIGEKRM
jgi:hypothetical protein